MTRHSPHHELTDCLKDWAFKQTERFTLTQAAEAIGLPQQKMTRDLTTRIGVALLKIGCKKIAVRNGPNCTTTMWVRPDRTPPVNAAPTDPGRLALVAKWKSEFAEMRRSVQRASPSLRPSAASFLRSDLASRSDQTLAMPRFQRLTTAAKRLLDRLFQQPRRATQQNSVQPPRPETPSRTAARPESLQTSEKSNQHSTGSAP